MDPKARQRLLYYACAFIVAFIIMNCAMAALHPYLSNFKDLKAKYNYYVDHIDDFDMVFIGDSRSYTNMHPDLIDPALGTSSYNLSYWTNWIELQYALFQDLAPRIPEDATVVWTLGDQNFAANPITNVYPISLSKIPNYLSIGYKISDFTENFFQNFPPLWFAAFRTLLMNRIDNELNKAAFEIGEANVFSSYSEIAEKNDQHEKEVLKSYHDIQLQGVARYYDGQELASIELIKHNGASYRVELTPEFYRAKQREIARDLQERRSSGEPKQARQFQPSESSYIIFLKTLDLLKENNVHVVVNIVEEAPYVYNGNGHLEEVRHFIKEKVKPEVDARGFGFVNVDYNRIKDKHYFDYNHMNSEGIKVFTPMFVKAMKPYLKEKGE